MVEAPGRKASCLVRSKSTKQSFALCSPAMFQQMRAQKLLISMRNRNAVQRVLILEPETLRPYSKPYSFPNSKYPGILLKPLESGLFI